MIKTKQLLFTVSIVIKFTVLTFSQISENNLTKYLEINESIRSSWDGELSKSNELPYVYITAWPYLPFMFYWDTYFTNIGLIEHKFDVVAKWNIENILSVVQKYGYMGNAAPTVWGMNRSQPPYLSKMVMDYYTFSNDTNFLKNAYPILLKEYLFWTDSTTNAIENHNTSIKGLQRFYHHAKNEEIEPQYEEISNRFNLPKNISMDEKIKTCIPYIVEAATGMDFTPRFEHRCPDFVALELNCLLYNYEENFSKMVKILNLENEPNWNKKAESRKNLINKYCWNEKKGMYYDYDYINKRHSKVAAVTSFQPLWAGIASEEQAKKQVSNLKVFEGEWGLATTEKCGEIKNYQWGETSIWAPMQMMVIMGLDRYGYKEDAKRIANKFLKLAAQNYDKPTPSSFYKNNKINYRRTGKIYEKYKVDGTINDDEYIASEMYGWSAATFIYSLKYIQK